MKPLEVKNTLQPMPKRNCIVSFIGEKLVLSKTKSKIRNALGYAVWINETIKNETLKIN